MHEVDFERVRAAFLAARDLEGQKRMEVLHRVCAGDAELRAEVESLLEHHDAQRGHVTTPVVGGELRAIFESPSVDEVLPRRFGAFELLEVIGRGGMGTVYRARQRTPDRTVALKVIRAGMLSRAMLRRFQYEADVLARLEHPNIARIFEAGTAEAAGVDQPYFALELVTGEPIDRYVNEHDLAVRDRLELMIKVCDAVHHAHQKGVIHRDLKPANILVDADGQPKVLDFGVARATDADIRSTTIHTNVGQLVGTLPYMSPEQVSGEPGRLDIRSDVYGLGVLTFELLAGRLPYDIQAKTIADAAVTIRDTQPTRLSATDPDLRGDLETITGTALEKDPSRRYASAAALAQDLRRYLTHQPIIARPPSVRYQVRLFARRHRALVAGAALGVAVLILATAGSAGFAVHAQRAAAREANQRRVAERTTEHLEAMLMLPDPHGAGAELTVVEMLDLMTQRLDGEEELPEVEARVRSAIGKTFMNLRQMQQAAEQLEQAVALWREIDPAGAPLARSLAHLGEVRFFIHQAAAGEAAYQEAIEIRERLGQTDLPDLLAALLIMLVRTGKFAEAKSIAQELLETARRGVDPVVVVVRLRKLAQVQSGLGDHDQAEVSLMEARELAGRHLPDTHPMHHSVLLDLSTARKMGGELEGAAEASREAFALADRAREPGSFDWTACLMTHASLLESLDLREELDDLLTSARASVVAAHGPDHHLARQVESRLEALRRNWSGPEQVVQEKAP